MNAQCRDYFVQFLNPNVMNELIKLKFKQGTISQKKTNEVVDAFIDACCRLEPSIFEPYMNEEDVFEDKDKWRFMTDFRDRLWKIDPQHTERLQVRLGNCKGCQCGAETHEFFDDKGRFYFAYLIEKEDGQVKDIYYCFWSSGNDSPF